MLLEGSPSSSEIVRVHTAIARYARDVTSSGKPKFTTLVECKPPEGWFVGHAETNHHGSGHVAQLLVLESSAYPFCTALGFRIDMEVQGWTSILHDIAQNGTSDSVPGHEQYAAQWARLHLGGVVSAGTLQKIVETILLHTVTTSDIPSENHDALLFKTVDKLARVRLGEDVSGMPLPIYQMEGHFGGYPDGHFAALAKNLHNLGTRMHSGDAYKDVLLAGRNLSLVWQL